MTANVELTGAGTASGLNERLELMGEKRDENCKECDGAGWVLDYLGGCGDPECCGGPFKVRCPYSD